MKHLIFIFTLFTLLSIPNLIIYSGYDAMKGMSNTLSVLTLGNLGFTSSNCFSVTKEIGSMTIFWNTGVFSNTIGSYGIMPSDSSNNTYWINGLGSSEYWQNRFNYSLFKTQYEEKWSNKNFWILTNIGDYFQGNKDEWNSNTSAFFINTECVQEEDQVNSKRYRAHYIVTICILMSLLFLVMLFYSNGHSQILAKEWDLKTLTAGDYTVCKRVNEEDYNNFTSNYSGNQSPAYAYMEHLKEQYEKEISKTSSIIEENDHIKIAWISFAFNNYEVIQLLEKRGSAISNRNIKSKEKIEKQLIDLSSKSFKEISRPIYMFITFETEEGYERAKKTKINGTYFKPAEEPTNIIWENYRITWPKKVIRGFITLSLLAVLLILTFLIFIILK